ncbi:hypothetical protein CROQUDRAFT_90457 [Cronartium quercuum f. sp. fusiforme G11]|uniref:Uncharacterized protein n=1 Tax=Cronartium quercuum f. sp. fusiforme G11 TaxID=708437 RepID=A0A9P6NQC4_9BASI|nr:hypothetical protein CROQUDRAFT_90457 [Cronartium quercuum f. sp. fusiforme G11]
MSTHTHDPVCQCVVFGGQNGSIITIQFSPQKMLLVEGKNEDLCSFQRTALDAIDTRGVVTVFYSWMEVEVAGVAEQIIGVAVTTRSPRPSSVRHRWIGITLLITRGNPSQGPQTRMYDLNLPGTARGVMDRMRNQKRKRKRDAEWWWDDMNRWR